MKTRAGDVISFEHHRGHTTLRVEGRDDETGKWLVAAADLTTDELMDLQNEVYIAIHGRPDPVIDQQKEADAHLKQLVKEAVSELLAEGISPQPPQPVTHVFNQTNMAPVSDFLAEVVAGWLSGGKPHGQA